LNPWDDVGVADCSAVAAAAAASSSDFGAASISELDESRLFRENETPRRLTGSGDKPLKQRLQTLTEREP